MQRTILRCALRAQPIQIARVATRASVLARPAVNRGINSRFTGMRFYSEEAKKAAEGDAAKAEASEEESKELPSAEELNEKLKALEEKYAKKDKEAAEFKDRYVRSVADFRNLQETTKREIQKAKDFALQKFAKDLLESIDNFGHALNAVSKESLEASKEIKDLYEGVQMTQNVFEKTLTRHGISKIDPIGEKFDPNVHEATFEIPQPDKEAGTIFHVQQPGYSLNNRVLRAAKVGVVKGSD